MNLLRAIYAERLKLKRTFALKMVVLAPLVVLVISLLLASQAPFSTLTRHSKTEDWRALVTMNLTLWGMMMLPLYLMLQVTLVSGVDHSSNQWKALFARPVPRWSFYVSKLSVVWAMVAASSLILCIGLLLEGALLHMYNSELRFGFPPPLGMILTDLGQMTWLSFLPLSILYSVSMRWRFFSPPLAVGIVAFVLNFVIVGSPVQFRFLQRYFPWYLPMFVVAPEGKPSALATIIWVSFLVGALIIGVGCSTFSNRDMT